MTQRIAVFPADRHSLYEEHGYSAAIRSGDLLIHPYPSSCMINMQSPNISNLHDWICSEA